MNYFYTYIKKHNVILLTMLIFVTVLSQCKTTATKKTKKKVKKTYLYQKKTQSAELSIANLKDILFSETQVIKERKKTKITYRYWRFNGASKDGVAIQFEEHYQAVKVKPDLIDIQKYKYESGSISLRRHTINIFKLNPTKMVYKVKTKKK